VNRGSEPVKKNSPQAGPRPSLALYERLIDDGIAEADERGGAIDHITARRIAIWLTAQPQQPAFAQALTGFTRTGAFSRDLVVIQRARARSPNSPNHAQAQLVLKYHASRGPDLGPISHDFGAACDQIDRADAMLIDLKDRTRQGVRPVEQPSTEPGIPAVTAHASQDSGNPTVTITMDAATAPHRDLRHRRQRQRTRGLRPRGHAIRPGTTRGLVRQAEPPVHRRPRNPRSPPPARHRTRLPNSARPRSPSHTRAHDHPHRRTGKQPTARWIWSDHPTAPRGQPTQRYR
jgi:hypothetical protein